MESKLLVSIIINNYNYDRFLAEAIDSALSQTYPNVEVIVVDDGSTDRSREIIASYSDRIIPVLQENGKQGKALNNGFAHSQGEIILFLDSDDCLLPQAVDRIANHWKPELAKIHYRLTVVDTEQQPLGFSYPPEGQLLANGQVWQELLRTSGYTSSPMSGNAYSRRTLQQIFPIPDEYTLTADDYLMISTPFYGEVIGIEEPLGIYRIHTSNQWALSSVSGSRFRRFVCHDLQNYALLVLKATEQGYDIPPDLERRNLGRMWSRLASLRLEPEEHPVASDRPLQLTYWGIHTLWHYSKHNLYKRFIYTVWFLWVGFMPVPLAALAISWLYAPHLRPKLIGWTLTRLRTLVS